MQTFAAEMAEKARKSGTIETNAFICADAAVAYLEHLPVHDGDGGRSMVTCRVCKDLWAGFEAAAAAYRASYE